MNERELLTQCYPLVVHAARLAPDLYADLKERIDAALHAPAPAKQEQAEADIPCIHQDGCESPEICIAAERCTAAPNSAGLPKEPDMLEAQDFPKSAFVVSRGIYDKLRDQAAALLTRQTEAQERLELLRECREVIQALCDDRVSAEFLARIDAELDPEIAALSVQSGKEGK